MYKDDGFTITNVTTSDPLGGEKSTTVTINRVQRDQSGNVMTLGQGYSFQITDPADEARFVKGAKFALMGDVVPPATA